MTREADQAAAMRRALRRGVVTAGFGLAAILLAVLAASRTEVGAAAIADILARARLGPLALALGAMTLAYGFMALRWRSLMPGLRASPAGLAAILCAGLLLNFAVPGPVGELGGAWFAHRRYGIATSRALAASLGARVVGLATAAGLAALFGTAFELPVPERFDRLVLAAALVIGLGGLVLATLAARPGWWRAASAATLGRLGGASLLARTARRLDAAVAALAEALAGVATLGPRPFLRAAAWSLAGHASVMGGIYLAAWSLGARPALGGVAFTYAASTAGTVALFALPGSQVGWDALFFGLLVATAGLAPADALGVALVVRVQQLGLLVLGAAATTWLLRGGGTPRPEANSI